MNIDYSSTLTKLVLHQSTAASTWWCGPRPLWLGRNGCWTFPRVSGTPGNPQNIFSWSCPLSDRSWAAHSFANLGRLFFSISYCHLAMVFLYSLACSRSLILLLLLMSGNIHPNPGPSPYPCSVCTSNVSWRGKSVQCTVCHKWVHLRCSQLSFSSFNALSPNHDWTCPPCSRPSAPPVLSSGGSQDSNTVPSTPGSISTYTSTVSPPTSPPSLSTRLPPHPPLVKDYPISATTLAPSAPASPTASGGEYHPASPAAPSATLRVLQWNAGGIRARGLELRHFVAQHPVDLICIQESNLNSSSSFSIPGYSAIRSDRTHARSGSISSEDCHTGGGVITFVRQGLSFTEFSTSPLSSLDPYSDYVGITLSMKDSPPLSFLNVYAPPIRSCSSDTRSDSFSPSVLPSSRASFILGDFNCHHPLWDSTGTPDSRGSEVFDWVISSDFLPLNDPDCPTLLHRSSGSRSSPDISLAPSSLALSCSWEVMGDLGSDHLPILISIPLCATLHSNERPSTFNFQKARWDDFSAHFDVHCPAPEDYFSLPLSSAASHFSSLALNAAKASIPFGRIKRLPQAWWSSEVEAAVKERRKRFATAHRGDEERQAYISASRHATSVIAKAKAAAWQKTCSGLSPKSNPRPVYSLLRSVAASSSGNSDPNFPNCSSPRETASVFATYLKSHFSVSQPRSLRHRARSYLNQLRHSPCPSNSHSSFCSPLTMEELNAALASLSSSTASGPDRVAYPMLRHLPSSGAEFLLHIFNLSWSSHSFPSIWKTSTIVPIHKVGKPTNCPASFRPISLTSCVSKLFERIILSRLLYFLESNSILSPCQAGFRPGRSTIDQVLFLSQSIWDGFNKPKPGSRTILASVDFSKAFDSVWHPALFYKLLLSGLPPCFVRWTQSFLSDRRACVSINSHRSRSFRVRRGVPQGSVLGPVLFSLFINDLPLSLPSSVSCSLYADDVAIWSSSPAVPVAHQATQNALDRLVHWSQHWCLPLNPGKCETSFFSMDPHQSKLQPLLSLLNSTLRFNPTPTFLGVTFDRTLSFSKHISSLKAKFFPRLKALRCISAASWGPSKESLSILYKAFLRPLLSYASPGWFPFLCDSNIMKLERLHRAASRAITGCLSSSPISLLLHEASLPPLRVTLTQFSLFSYERALRLPPSFPLSGLARQQVKARLRRGSWRRLASSHPLIPSLSYPREDFEAFPPSPPWDPPSFTVGLSLSSPCSRTDPLPTRQRSALSHLDSLPAHDLTIWTDGSVPFTFGKGGSGVLATCSICDTEVTLSFSAGPVCSSFSAEARAILHALQWTRQHSQVCRLSSALFLTDSRSVLSLLSSFLTSFHHLANLARNLESLLLYRSQAAMGSRTLIFAGK